MTCQIIHESIMFSNHISCLANIKPRSFCWLHFWSWWFVMKEKRKFSLCPPQSRERKPSYKTYMKDSSWVRCLIDVEKIKAGIWGPSQVLPIHSARSLPSACALTASLRSWPHWHTERPCGKQVGVQPGGAVESPNVWKDKYVHTESTKVLFLSTHQINPSEQSLVQSHQHTLIGGLN